MAIKDYMQIPAHKKIKLQLDLYEVDHLLYR